jgi:hypothetical protein
MAHYVVAGVTGRVGSTVATELLKQSERVPVIVRDEARGLEWTRRGAESPEDRWTMHPSSPISSGTPPASLHCYRRTSRLTTFIARVAEWRTPSPARSTKAACRMW